MQEDLLQPPAFQVTLRCKEHKQGLIVKGCADQYCKRKKILLCQQCLSEDAHMEHNNNVLGIKQFITQFSQSINQATQQNKSQLEEFLKSDDNLKVYKYIQDNKHHLKKVRDNIDTQKTLVAQDMTFIVEQFQVYLQQVKESVFKKLDSIYQDYESLFEQTRRSFNSKFFPAANYFLSTPMALTCKLGQQGDNSEEYLKKLKQIDNSSLDLLYDQFNRLLIANETPKIFESEPQKLLLQLQEPLQNYFLGWCSGNIDRQPPPPQLQYQYSNNSNNSNNSAQVYSPPQKIINRENYGLSDSFSISKSGIYSKFSRAIKLEWPHVKSNRKFTLDFQIGAVIGLSKSTFVLLGQNDSKLRVFDPEKKTLLAFDGHYQQANFIEQLGPNSFITGADDGQIFYWQYSNQSAKIVDQFSFSSKPILAGLDLQNNTFAFIDLDGRLGYKNIDSRFELFLSLQNPNRYMVKQRKQFKMTLIKPGELFYVYIPGEQGASIIQVSEREKALRRLNANTLPTGQSVFPLSANEVLLATATGLRICSTNSDEILAGGDVDIALLEFTNSQTIFVLSIPVEGGQSSVYRILKNGQFQYDIQQKELPLESISQLSSKLKPRLQLIKNQDKLQMVIVDQNRIHFFDINIK